MIADNCVKPKQISTYSLKIREEEKNVVAVGQQQIYFLRSVFSFLVVRTVQCSQASLE